MEANLINTYIRISMHTLMSKTQLFLSTKFRTILDKKVEKIRGPHLRMLVVGI